MLIEIVRHSRINSTESPALGPGTVSVDVTSQTGARSRVRLYQCVSALRVVEGASLPLLS